MRKFFLLMFVLSISVSNIKGQRGNPVKPVIINDGIWYNNIFMSKDGVHGWICGDLGEILLTENGGKSWIPIKQTLTKSWILGMFFLDDNKEGWAVGNFGVVLHSTDGGYNWKLLNIKAKENLYSINFFDDKKTGIITGGKGNIYKTIDGGISWEKISTGYSELIIYGCQFIDGRNALLNCDRGSLLKSSNDLNDWDDILSVELSDQLDNPEMRSIKKHGDIVWIGCTKGTILKYDIKSKKFNVKRIDSEWGIRGFWSNAKDEKGFLVTGGGEFFETLDNGENWILKSKIASDDAVYVSMSFNRDEKNGVIVGSNRNIARTNDGGEHWIVENKINTDLSEIELDRETDKNYVCGSNGILLETSSDFKDWKRISPANFRNKLNGLTLLEKADMIFSVGDSNTIVRYNKSNNEWKLINKERTNSYFNSIASSRDEQILFVVGSNSQLYKSNDQGEKWDKILLGNKITLSDIYVSRRSNQVWVVGSNSSLFHTDNNFKSSSKIPVTDTSEFLLSMSFCSNEKTGFIVSTSEKYDKHIFKTIDGGNNWEKIQGIDDNEGLQNVQVSNNDSIVIASSIEGDIYVSYDMGGKWFKASPKYTWQRLCHFGFNKKNEVSIVGYGGLILKSGTFEKPKSFDISIKEFDDSYAAGIKMNGNQEDTQNVVVFVESSVINGKFIQGYDKKYDRISSKFNDLDSIDHLPKSIIPPNSTVLFKISVFDGWNLYVKEIKVRFGKTLWEQVKETMFWDKPIKTLSVKEWAAAISINLTLLTLFYIIATISLYLFSPITFIKWHEAVSNSKLPLPEKLPRFLFLFLIESSRSADAFVKYYLSKSLNLFYDNLETQTRKFWVPAPFRIEDKDIVSFSNNELTYVPGLTEIKSMLNPSRIIISIEGPGGVGKSSFAFQIARWGFDSNPVKRIQKHKIIPLFVNKLSQNLDEACKDKLQYIMNSTTISNSLYKSLLRNKRVLAVVDGISEINALSQDWIDAEKGAKEIQFVVYTSRKPLHFPESITIIPLGLKISYLDSLIDGFTNSYVGANKFEDEREVLRTRIKMILSEINKSDPDRPVPLVILRLMIQQASDLVDQGKHLSDELPNNLSSLFENYISDLLRNTDSPKEAERDLLKAAVVSMGLSELFNKRKLLNPISLTLNHNGSPA